VLPFIPGDLVRLTKPLADWQAGQIGIFNGGPDDNGLCHVAISGYAAGSLATPLGEIPLFGEVLYASKEMLAYPDELESLSPAEKPWW
jgi:hypothetical protein